MAASITHGEIAVVPAVVVGVIVAVVSLLVGSNRGDIRVDIALASMASFLFGALLAFTIVRTRERLAKVHDLIARGHACLLSIYQIMGVFGEEQRDRTRGLIDSHLIDQIDYRLVDYHAATQSHDRLVEQVFALEPATPQEEGVYRELVQLCVQLGQDRVLIEAATGQAMSPIEWSGLLLLLLVLLALIAVLPGGTIPGAIVAGVLAAALVTLMVLLRMLDLLRWHERVTIWEPTSRLFRSMGSDPYVPREVIEKGRFQPTGRIRVVDFADPYPIRTTKTITVEEFPAVSANGSSGSRSRSASSIS
jgi:hypothetical protein